MWIISGLRIARRRAYNGPVNRDAAVGPGFVQELGVEQASGEALSEGVEGFGGGRAWGRIGAREIVSVGAL